MKTKIVLLFTALLTPLIKVKADWEMPDYGGGANEIHDVPENFDDTLINIINYILGFVGAIAVLALIWGGVQYLTAAGNQDMVRSGKDTIKNGLIGLVVAGLSYAIVNVIIETILK